MGSNWYEITLAVIMCTMGFIYLFSACACSEYAHQYQQDTSEKVAASQAAKGQGGSSASSDLESGGRGPSSVREMENGDQRRKMNDNPFGASDDAEYSRKGAYTGGGY